jgi:hypothetical protein
MTDRLFPESVLFKNMQTKYIELRNRQLKVADEKTYHVALI